MLTNKIYIELFCTVFEDPNIIRNIGIKYLFFFKKKGKKNFLKTRKFSKN